MIFERLDFCDDDTPRDGALNMAIDEALALSASLPVLRVYRWKRRAVSFGYFGAHREVSARWPGRELVRRWTGGGEVPHGEDFTYTLAVPKRCGFSLVPVRESYRALHAALATLLPGAELATTDASEAPECFARPVVADLVLSGRKVAGAAQRRGTFGMLHQGSVQCPVAGDFGERLASTLARSIVTQPLSSALLDAAESIAARKYASAAWLERR